MCLLLSLCSQGIRVLLLSLYVLRAIGACSLPLSSHGSVDLLSTYVFSEKYELVTYLCVIRPVWVCYLNMSSHGCMGLLLNSVFSG